MLEKSDASAYVDTERGLFQRVAASCIPLEILVADIDAPLRTGEDKDIGKAAKPYAISHVDWDVEVLLFNGGCSTQILTNHIVTPMHLSFLLVIKGRDVEAQACQWHADLQHRAKEEASLVVGCPHVVVQLQAADVQATFHAELDLRGSGGCQAKSQTQYHDCLSHLILI